MVAASWITGLLILVRGYTLGGERNFIKILYFRPIRIVDSGGPGFACGLNFPDKSYYHWHSMLHLCLDAFTRCIQEAVLDCIGDCRDKSVADVYAGDRWGAGGRNIWRTYEEI